MSTAEAEVAAGLRSEEGALENVQRNIREARSRKEQLRERARELDAEIEAQRDEVGRLVARDAPAGELDQARSDLRDLDDELDGIARALEVLDSDLSVMETRREELEMEEAHAAEERLQQEAREAIDHAAEMVAEIAPEIVRQYEAVGEKLSAAQDAERRVLRLQGSQRAVPTPKAYQQYGEHTRLPMVLDELRAFAAHKGLLDDEDED